MLQQDIYTLSKAVPEPQTRVESECLLVSYAPEEDVSAWNELSDSLIGWALHCEEDDEGDGLKWPSRALLAKAYSVACAMRDAKVPVPSNVVPNGEGGVAFEWQVGPYFTKIELAKDGSSEFLAFDHGKLVFRGQLP